MHIILNRNSSLGLYKQIYTQIRELIYKKDIPYMYLLPAERKLAKILHVDRSTVAKAYEQLKSEGLIESFIGKGTFVSFTFDNSHISNPSTTCFDWDDCFELKAETKYDDVIDLIMNADAEDGKVFFAGGLPSPDAFPSKAFHEIKEKILENQLEDLFAHSPVAGIKKLRLQLKNMMQNHQIQANMNEIMVTSGSQQGLDLVIRAFVNKGDVVMVEEHSFFGALQLFKQVGAKIIAVPMDAQGLKVDVLEPLIAKHHPKLIYTIPTFHNPTGITMSLSRRKKLIELSHYYRIPIIEDDPYGLIHYETSPLPSLKSLDTSNYVIYLSTFSKTISLGLRTGWVCASKEVIKRLVKIKQITDLHVNTINQYFLSEFIAANLYAQYIHQLQHTYRVKRDFMVTEIHEHFDDIELITPHGGFYIWLGFKKEVDMRLLFDRAYLNGVVFTPGYYFLADKKQRSKYIRLNFTFPSLKQIKIGIMLLKKSYDEMTT